jgi:hypothetical protein
VQWYGYILSNAVTAVRVLLWLGALPFFGKQICAKKKECKMGFEPETCCSSSASTTTAQLQRLIMEADRFGIYPFNLWVSARDWPNSMGCR